MSSSCGHRLVVKSGEEGLTGKSLEMKAKSLVKMELLKGRKDGKRERYRSSSSDSSEDDDSDAVDDTRRRQRRKKANGKKRRLHEERRSTAKGKEENVEERKPLRAMGRIQFDVTR